MATWHLEACLESLQLLKSLQRPSMRRLRPKYLNVPLRVSSCISHSRPHPEDFRPAATGTMSFRPSARVRARPFVNNFRLPSPPREAIRPTTDSSSWLLLRVAPHLVDGLYLQAPKPQYVKLTQIRREKLAQRSGECRETVDCSGGLKSRVRSKYVGSPCLNRV
jgi:hypothetical protein